MSLRIHKAVVLILAGSSAWAAELPAALQWGGTNDVVIDRAFIPSPQNRHGEVRLVRRGNASCVQTLLYSAMMKRGLKAIRNKEWAAWPPESDFYADSSRYLAMLKKAESSVGAAFSDRANPADKRRKLLIEFIASGEIGFVALYEPDIRGTGDEIEVIAARPLFSASVSAGYARRAMDLMIDNAFGLPDAGEP